MTDFDPLINRQWIQSISNVKSINHLHFILLYLNKAKMPTVPALVQSILKLHQEAFVKTNTFIAFSARDFRFH